MNKSETSAAQIINKCVMSSCNQQTVNLAVATCYDHISVSCFEHPGSVYITKFEYGEATYDIRMCPQCVIGLNEGNLEIKEGVDYTQAMRNAPGPI